MKTRIPCPGNPCALKTQLFMLFQHFAGYTTLYYFDGQQVESIGTSPWCIIHDGHHGPSALKTHWKQMLIYYSIRGVFFSTDGQQVFLGSSTHNAQVQRQLRPLSRATKTSLFFLAPTRLWCLGQGIRGCTRYSSGKKIWWARINWRNSVEKCLEHQSSAKQTSITSMVRATGIQFPINDGMTIPLYGKTLHVLTIAHITTNNDKERSC